MKREAIYSWTQVIITIGLLAVTLYLAVAGKEVPGLLSNLTTLAVGYFFGQQVEQKIIAANLSYPR